ncbi:hypothetical protein F5146DRAFT_1144052 [Armillaria mellea]|nr:hypothetical protein F5146DRAFT_1144052 [Armillaria mellea]
MSDSPASLAFFKHVVGMGAEEILVKFEQFCCVQSLNMNSHEDSKDLCAQCNGINSERIKNNHGLDGWPMGLKFKNLFNIKNLQDL